MKKSALDQAGFLFYNFFSFFPFLHTVASFFQVISPGFPAV